nr:alcohol dehydrogenase catalytic domain-containing protein [Mycobacterium sp. E342]
MPDPVPEAGRLVLEIGRCGICGTDLHMTSGEGETFPEGMVLGHEFAGEVVAKGADTDGFNEGDIVAALPVTGCGNCASCKAGDPAVCSAGFIGSAGGYGQYAIAKATAAIRLPASMSLEDGALVEPMAVGLHGATLAQLSPGAKVLVIGAGPIGIASTYWAKRLGAGKIVVAARSRRGEPYAIEMGADTFALTDENLDAAVTEGLGGPPDVIFECAGVPGVLAMAINIVRPRGTVIVLGNCMVPDTIFPAQAMFKQVRIQGSNIYSVGEFQVVADSFDAGHVEPRSMISDTWNYDELPTRFEELRSGSDQCKVMVNPWA